MFDIERIRASWQREAAAVDAVVGTINDSTAHEPVRGDGWSTQDLLGHIANSARGLMIAARDGAVAAINLDEFNEQQRQRGRSRAWQDVQAYWGKARDEVAAFLADVDGTIADKPVSLPHLPTVQTAGDALRVLIMHTRSHREEIEQGFPEVQA